MSDANEKLAKVIVAKLEEAKLISGKDKQVVSKLAKGMMTTGDWKVALEEVINAPKAKSDKKDETK